MHPLCLDSEFSFTPTRFAQMLRITIGRGVKIVQVAPTVVAQQRQSHVD